MFNYKNQTCPVCGETFKENDDIVVCPDCGTPYHRRCWAKNGGCVNADKHGTGFEWKPLFIAGVNDERNVADITCPNCGRKMPRGTLFCENCGTKLAGEDMPQNENTTANPNNGRFGSPFDNENYKAQVERRLAGEIDGVAVKDIAAYIGFNAGYYIYKFKKMDSNPKYKPFNGTAFLFRPLWFVFRKMGKWAIITALINGLLGMPNLIVSAVQIGALPASSPLYFKDIETVALLFSVLEIMINIYIGFKANVLYRKNVIKDLNKLKATSRDENEYHEKIIKQSGPSKVGIAIICRYAIIYTFYVFLLF